LCLQRCPVCTIAFAQRDLTCDSVTDRHHLRRKQLLPRRTLFIWRANGDSYIFRERLQLLLEGGLAIWLFDPPDRLRHFLNLFVDLGLSRFVSGDFFGRRQRMIVVDEREKHRHHTVIIHLRDRIELVVMTSGAGNRQT
jgi:hypothetical protein